MQLNICNAQLQFCVVVFHKVLYPHILGVVSQLKKIFANNRKDRNIFTIEI